MKRIIFGTAGGPYAQAAAELAGKLTDNGYAVDVILLGDQGAARALESATGRRVYAASAGVDDSYLALANGADLAVVAPATPAAIARLTAGLADDLLTAALLALGDVPVLLCPATDAATYRNPITQRNRRELDNLGYYFLDPRVTEDGRALLAETDRILERIGDMLDPECWGAYI